MSRTHGLALFRTLELNVAFRTDSTYMYTCFFEVKWRLNLLNNVDAGKLLVLRSKLGSCGETVKI